MPRTDVMFFVNIFVLFCPVGFSFFIICLFWFLWFVCLFVLEREEGRKKNQGKKRKEGRPCSCGGKEVRKSWKSWMSERKNVIKYIFYKNRYMLFSLGVDNRKQKVLNARLSPFHQGLGSL